jgi:hypothetical protein
MFPNLVNITQKGSDYSTNKNHHLKKPYHFKLSMVIHSCNPSILEAEARGS